MTISTLQVTGEEVNSESIYDILNHDIINLRLKPGAMMSIKDICEHYDAGRSPVRDALIRLEQEELITFLPQRGTLISRIDFDRVEDQRFLRYSVEENVMREFMASHTSSDIARLESIIWEQEACLAKKDLCQFLDVDDAFHKVFYEGANRMYCFDALKNLSGHYRRLRLLTSTDLDISKNVIGQHKGILTALCARDMSQLQEAISSHLCKVTVQEKMLQERYPDLFVQSMVPGQKPNLLHVDFLNSLIEF